MRTYLQVLSPFIGLSAVLFGLGVVLGLAMLRVAPEMAAAIMADVEEFIGTARGLSRLEIFLFIVTNNVFKTLVMMMLGVILGIAPVFFLVSNGAVLAIVAAGAGAAEGAAVVIAGLVPHGIIELAAVFMGAAAGLHLGTVMVQRILARPVLFMPWVKSAWRLFVRVLLPMLILAGAIETWITPAVAELARG
ncbi:MAG: stage II sporulation protein M [Rhodospirillales bacterium]|nr:MAG: stage II sporulation protein M [Rhodospirillales bacterium]